MSGTSAPPGGARARIQDVARAAGVSIKTVSRVVNREPGVHADTRRRVLAIADRLDYRPDPAARRLAGGRSNLVALLYDNPSASYVMAAMEGVIDACQARGYRTMLQPLDRDDAELLRKIEALVSHARPDGVVLTPPLTDLPPLLDTLDALGVPFASISPGDRHGNIGVTLREHDAACEMVGHLAVLGHRRIAHVRGHPLHAASTWRLDGYREGLRRAGIPYDPSLVVQGHFLFQSGQAAARRLLSLPAPPTAIFAANDEMAAGVVSVLLGNGIAVPDAISVCGFDDAPVSRRIHPALTTIRQPVHAMALEAAHQLIGTLSDPAAGRLVELPHTLVVRASTARAPLGVSRPPRGLRPPHPPKAGRAGANAS